MTKACVLAFGLAVLSAVAIAPAGAGSGVAVDLMRSAWGVFTPAGKRPADFRDRAGGGLEVRADNAVSFLYQEIAAPDRSQQALRWRWRVDQAPSPSDLTRPDGGDRPLAIHAWFPKPEHDRTLWDHFKDVVGIPVMGHVITYVWGGTGKRGDVLDNPNLETGALVILRGGATRTGIWFEEEVDLAADFIAAFGHPSASPAQYLVISADTDDLGGIARGAVVDLELGEDHGPG